MTCAPRTGKIPISGVYREIVKPERLVISAAALDRNKKPIFEVLQTFIFAERGKKTKVTARARVTKVHALEAYLYAARHEVRAGRIFGPACPCGARITALRNH